MFNVALDPHSTFTVRFVSQIELQSLYLLLASQIRFTDVVFKYLLDISIRFSAWETSAINHSINCYICNMQNNLQLRWLCRNSNSISMFWTPRQLCCVPDQLKDPVFIILSLSIALSLSLHDFAIVRLFVHVCLCMIGCILCQLPSSNVIFSVSVCVRASLCMHLSFSHLMRACFFQFP